MQHPDEAVSSEVGAFEGPGRRIGVRRLPTGKGILAGTDSYAGDG